MTITGLEGNGYLINNPIMISVSGTEQISRMEVLMLNLQNGKSTRLPNLFPEPSNQKVEFRLDKAVKGLFTEPVHNTDYTMFSVQTLTNNTNAISLTFTITYLSGLKDIKHLIRTFIRGGKYNDLNNQNIPSNSILNVTETLPRFSGYPFAFYVLNNNFKVQKYNLQTPLAPDVPVEIIREKSCNGKYLKFLNSLGGYSYWLFDNYEDEDTSSNLGIVNNGFNKKDLGSSYQNSFKVFGKIPERFYPMMRDLILSPEIYEWQKVTQTWKRIYSDGNKWVHNGVKIAYKVEYKFSDFNNYNPSLL